MKQTIKISCRDLIDLIHYDRRYCDGRSTYSPSEFNQIYSRIRSDNPNFIKFYDIKDKTLMNEGEFWPYAQDGMYNPETGTFDAR